MVYNFIRQQYKIPVVKWFGLGRNEVEILSVPDDNKESRYLCRIRDEQIDILGGKSFWKKFFAAVHLTRGLQL